MASEMIEQVLPIRELKECLAYTMSTPKEALWTIGTIGLEGLAQLQGHYDVMRKRSHHIWQAVESTRALEDAQCKLRRICNTQSVIVFHISRESADETYFQREYEERLNLQMSRKLLPILRKYIRRDDLLNLNGGETLVAVLNAERSDAEQIALRLKKVMEEQRVPLGRKQVARPIVGYHAVSFAQ